MLTQVRIETHAVRFDAEGDARSFVRAIRKRGWEARRRGQRVFVVIRSADALDLMVRQWASRTRRGENYNRYEVEE